MPGQPADGSAVEQRRPGPDAVRVGTLQDGDGFYVADDGPGIPPAEREAVFAWRHSTKEGGYGVGLRSVASVCDANGWTVEVAESRDGGARFEVRGATLVD